MHRCRGCHIPLPAFPPQWYCLDCMKLPHFERTLLTTMGRALEALEALEALMMDLTALFEHEAHGEEA